MKVILKEHFASNCSDTWFIDTKQLFEDPINTSIFVKMFLIVRYTILFAIEKGENKYGIKFTRREIKYCYRYKETNLQSKVWTVIK